VPPRSLMLQAVMRYLSAGKDFVSILPNPDARTYVHSYFHFANLSDRPSKGPLRGFVLQERKVPPRFTFCPIHRAWHGAQPLGWEPGYGPFSLIVQHSYKKTS